MGWGALVEPTPLDLVGCERRVLLRLLAVDTQSQDGSEAVKVKLLPLYYILMAYIVMAYIGMARKPSKSSSSPCIEPTA